MPKKIMRKNTKATAAKKRKQKAAETLKKKQQQLKDKKWKKKSKLVEKKLKKKEKVETNRSERLKRKAGLKELLKKKTKSITKAKLQSPTKTTRAQINSTIKGATKTNTKAGTHLSHSLTENLKRLQEEFARSIDRVISVLSKKKQVVDRHLEKRLKAAHKAFEEERMKEIKKANPGLKLSQLKQIVFKEWQTMQNATQAYFD